MKEKILGCLLGAAIADAMGAPTELRTRKQIEEFFGGYLTEFRDCPEDTFARFNKPGMITDDFSMAYVTCNEIIKNNGVVNLEVAKNSLIEWSKDESFFNKFVGPTSRLAIMKMRYPERYKDDKKAAFVPVNDNMRGSNGVAMKASPIALLSKGDEELAMEIVALIATQSHNNNLAIAGGAAIAASTAAAYRGEGLSEIIERGIFGAYWGEKKGCETGAELAGPSVAKRIELAVHLASISKDLSEAIDTMADYFDCSGMAADSVPVAYGLMVAAKGDAMRAIEAAVNVGYDTDTIATMIGGILGCMHGVSAFDLSHLELINKANGYDLETFATEIERTNVVLEN